MGVLNMMKKYTILLILLVILTGCKGKEGSNTVSIDAPEDYVLFENLSDKLDIKNAGLSTYDYTKEAAFLLDISKEADYEKYFYKKYVDNVSEYEKSELEKTIDDFINNGNSIASAYSFIGNMYVNKGKLLEISKFGSYCFPYYDFAGSDVFKDKLQTCYQGYEIGAELYRKANLGLLKARNMLKYAIENQLKEESDKVRADAHLLIAISYLAQDELYQILEVKKHAALWKELGGDKVEIFSKETNKELNELLKYVAYNENTGVIELLKDGIEKGFINQVVSLGGVYNYLNDDFYLPVSIVKRDENQYAINPFFTVYHDEQKVFSTFPLLVKPEKPIDVSSYNVQNNLDRLYNNQLYILPLNGAVYILEMKDNKPLKVEFLNPAYYDTSYFRDETMKPIIVNDYGYDMLQRDYISYEKGSGEFVWNGNIKDQQPDKSKLFKLRNVMDCLHGNDERLIDFCSNRGRLIRAKYEHDNYKCRNKENCFMTVDDMIKRGDY